MAPAAATDQVGKYNPYHDERGQFTTPENAVSPGSNPPPIEHPPGEPDENKPSSDDVQVAGDPREDIPPGANAELTIGADAQAMIHALAVEALVNRGLSKQAAALAYEAVKFIRSVEFNELVDAYKNGLVKQVTFDGYVVQYEPGIPQSCSAVTLFSERGFVMGPQAFSEREETSKTILQELYRLNTSEIAGTGYPGGPESPNAVETNAARDFANRAFAAILRAF